MVAFVWTNYFSEDPLHFEAVPMSANAPNDGHQLAYSCVLPHARLGTFIVTAYVVLGGLKYWAPEYERRMTRRPGTDSRTDSCSESPARTSVICTSERCRSIKLMRVRIVQTSP